jgi:hypothetical protein
MNVSPSITNYYENLRFYRCGENKPNFKRGAPQLYSRGISTFFGAKPAEAASAAKAGKFAKTGLKEHAQLKAKALKYTIGHYGKIYSR